MQVVRLSLFVCVILLLAILLFSLDEKSKAKQMEEEKSDETSGEVILFHVNLSYRYRSNTIRRSYGYTASLVEFIYNNSHVNIPSSSFYFGTMLISH